MGCKIKFYHCAKKRQTRSISHQGFPFCCKDEYEFATKVGLDHRIETTMVAIFLENFEEVGSNEHRFSFLCLLLFANADCVVGQLSSSCGPAASPLEPLELPEYSCTDLGRMDS